MLSIGAMSAGQENYYLSLASEDYYLSGGEPQGIWVGEGAKTFDLSGVVEESALRNLFAGYSPTGSRPLVQRQHHASKAIHRPGWDLTFSAPKSVSVLWSQVDASTRKEIQEAHFEAVKTALNWLEETATLTRRGRGGKEMEGCKSIFACFEHSTSRALDPQLHTHSLLLNVGVRADGTTSTINSLQIFKSKMAAGAIYRADLAYRLEQKLGLSIVRSGSCFEIKGVLASLIREFSKRRTAIQSELMKRQTHSAEAAAVAAIRTRESKEAVPRAELLSAWQAVGKNLLWGPNQANALTRRRLPQLVRARSIPTALSLATQRCVEEQAHFTRRDFVRFFAEECQGRGISGSAILQKAESYLANSRLVVRLGSADGIERFTTPEMLKLEVQVLSNASKLDASKKHPVSAKAVEHRLSFAPHLSEEQRQAVSYLTRESGGLAVVSGLAGTGKTTMLGVCRDIWEAQGFKVVGAALSGRAANELEEGAKISSSTIAKLLTLLHFGNCSLNSKTVLVVDEASMVGSREMERLTAMAAAKKTKLVLVGDERQLQPIGVGAPFALLGDKFGRCTLTEIVRQSAEWARQAVKDVAYGKGKQALQAFADKGQVHVADSKSAAISELIDSWQRDPNPLRAKLILTSTRADVREINRRVQERLLKTGEISKDSVAVGDSHLHKGDRVIFTKGRKSLGVLNGTMGQLQSISSITGRITVKTDSGKRVTFHPRLMSDVAPAYAMTTHKGQGATSSSAYLLTGGSMQDREISYVQASRAKEETQIFLTRTDAGDHIEQLGKQMERSRQKTNAVTQIPKAEISQRLRL